MTEYFMNMANLCNFSYSSTLRLIDVLTALDWMYSVFVVLLTTGN